MLNREQMQEQLIRYSEAVRSVDAAYAEMTERVSDHTQQLNRLDTAITDLENRMSGRFIEMLRVATTELGNDTSRVESRVDALESHNRTFWTRVRFLFTGR